MAGAIEWRTIEAIDLLQLRGNHQFGAPGSYGHASLPPWPSVVAGALRSRMLVDSGVDVDAFGRGDVAVEEPLASVLGTPELPGTFRLAWLSLARWGDDQQTADALLPCPGDLVVDGENGDREPVYALPFDLPVGTASSTALHSVPLARLAAAKRKAGLLMSGAGFAFYVAGRLPTRNQLVSSASLYLTDERPGVGLDPDRRAAAEGQLFTTEGVAFRARCGLLAGATGCNGLLPADGLLRLGGDGRAAEVRSVSVKLPAHDPNQVGGDKQFRLTLTSPGCFGGSWLPPGVTCDKDGDHILTVGGLRARLRCFAAAGEPQVISGWDLARRKPKAATSFVPAGSVYWFDQVEGDVSILGRVSDEGLWFWTDRDGGHRRAEGFNNALVAAWPQAQGNLGD